MRWVERVASMGESRGVYKVLVEKTEGKRALERPRCWWEDNIKMEGMDWIDLTQGRDRRQTVVNAVMNRRVP